MHYLNEKYCLTCRKSNSLDYNMLKKYNRGRGEGVDSSAQILTVFPQYCYFQLSVVLNMLMGLQGSSVCSEKGVADLLKAKAPQEELAIHLMSAPRC